ncbi:MAG: leucine--tRNA ligase [archaeon]|jgi:leucyl-tRNA synthetase
MVIEAESTKAIDFLAIERKWQSEWETSKIFTAKEDSSKKKCYVLEMYPYPSASFLHMGHVRNFTIGDIFARFKRMNNFNVLYPMGYDSFGLPAETAAKKEGIHPRVYTEGAIKKIMEYQKAMGNSYDWDRVLASHEPDYYKWNQFFFVKLFEKGLAFRKKAPVNWCETCQSVLANEEAESGKCWRCNNDVVQKDMEQWFLKITEYADRLLEDLDKVEWPQKIKTMQKNWIGKSEGVNINFKLKDSSKVLKAFTTRCDTIFSVTFIAVAPESPIVGELVNGTKYENEVKEFVSKCVKEKIEDRTNEEKEKEGIFTGKYVINPANGEEIPVYVSNFALLYGTGVVMCDAHDKRDFRFARKYNIPLKFVISKDGKEINPRDFSDAFIEDGILFGSEQFSGMNNREALPKMASWLAENNFGEKVVNYSIRDWLVSRQRYWGTPIPAIHCEKCGVVMVPEKDLPVLLPETVDFKVSGNPLNSNPDFVNTKCPKCGGAAKRETDTMGGFVDSSWYFLRYTDNKNKTQPFDPAKAKYWMPVDQYVGGAEHAVMHLMYARFFIKALKDLGYVDFDEPFQKLFNQGIVYKDGAKMSKSKGNVVFQTDISNKYGIDTARLFLMFVSSPDKQMEWSDEGVDGAFRIINKFFRVSEKVSANKSVLDKKTLSKLNIAIRDVTKNVDTFDYPKCVIAISTFLDYLSGFDSVPRSAFEELLKLVSPFCPHVAEELWHKIGNKTFVSLEKWPVLDESLIDENLERIDVIVDNLRTDIIRVKELAKIAKVSKVKIFVAPEWKWTALEVIKKACNTRPDFGAAIKAVTSDPDLRKYGGEIPIFVKTAMNKFNDFVLLEKFDEVAVLNEAKPVLESEFGVIEIIKASDSTEAKAKNAFPGKPALLIE